MKYIKKSDIEYIKENNGIFSFLGDIPGNVTTILSGVHGDEIYGPISILNVLKNIKVISGKVNFIIGNIKGLEINQRYVDSDMNRLFVDSIENGSYELSRVKEILPLLLESNYLLDIHNTFGQNSNPFLISENEKDIFDVKYVVSGFDKLHSGSSDQFMNSISSKGYCLEVGSGVGSVELGEDSIHRFLNYTNNINYNSLPNSNKATLNYNFEYSYETKTNNFKLVKKFKDFDMINKGELIGYDGTEEVRSLFDGVIIFAYEPLNSSRIAFCLGK